jgi:hypothetical protein
MTIRKISIWKIISCSVLVMGTSLASFFDNRYFPPFERPFVTVECRPSHASLDIFGLSSSRAWGVGGKLISLPELQGELDQVQWAQSFVRAGLPNPLRPEWQFDKLPWNMDGKIQAQGLVAAFRQQIVPWLSIGFYALVMRVQSHFEFFLKKSDIQMNFTEGDIIEIEELRRIMSQTIGLCSDNSRQAGVGDIDLYLRFGKVWDYPYKFRRIDAGLRLGVLIPTGQRAHINFPASIPFGGNKHWGIYICSETEFELKEDWKFGMWFLASKRFKRTQVERMPLGQEPLFLGLAVGDATVYPGFSFVFTPYFSLENVREGLGLRVQYTLTKHAQDRWLDERFGTTVPVNIKAVEDVSSWTSEYITLMAFYDFGKTKACRSFEPIIRIAWDIPQELIAAHRVAKTHKISLGIEFNW